MTAPVTVSIAFPPRIVRQIDWRVPNGPMGLMGWQLAMGGLQVIPTEGDKFILANDEHATFYPVNYPDSGAWQVIMYNTGTFAHSVYLTFHLDLPGRMLTGPAQRLIPLTALTGVPPLVADPKTGRAAIDPDWVRANKPPLPGGQPGRPGLWRSSRPARPPRIS